MSIPELIALVVAVSGFVMAATGLVVAIKSLFGIGEVHKMVNSRMTEFIARYDNKVRELDDRTKSLAETKQTLKDEKAK